MEVLYQAVAFVHYGGLLLQRHGDWVFVGVAVKPDFMACFRNHAALFWEGFEGVAGDEPGGFDVVFFEHFEEAPDADRPGEETCLWSCRLSEVS